MQIDQPPSVPGPNWLLTILLNYLRVCPCAYFSGVKRQAGGNSRGHHANRIQSTDTGITVRN